MNLPTTNQKSAEYKVPSTESNKPQPRPQANVTKPTNASPIVNSIRRDTSWSVPATRPAPSGAAPMQWNLSIDFSNKNKPGTGRDAVDRTSIQRHQYNNRRPQKRDAGITSEAFLRHRDEVKQVRVQDFTKLIKKDEVPLRIIPLGGMEQVGINCTILEYKNDIIIIDAGIEFATPEMHGVDYMIPDINYLTKKKKNIRGILITHGHLDHIWALKHILPELDFPMIYVSPLSLGLIRKSMDEKDNKQLKYKIVDPDMDILKLGVFTVEIFRVNHNIPESMWFAIHSPKGLIVTAWDYKIDHTPAIDKPADIWKMSRIGQEWVRLFMGESTNAAKPGHSISEKIIGQNLDSIIRDCKKRIIVSTFASNIGRVMQLIDSAVKYNRVVFLAWRSMINNVKLCQELGYIKVPPQMIRPIGPDVEQMPDERIMIICTGSQGEEFSALVRMSTNTYKDFSLSPTDVVLLSSHTIPGNEKPVIDMINDLIHLKVEIIDDNDLDVHSSGHGKQEDIKMMMAMFKPEYYAPIYGDTFMRHANKKIAISMWISDENIMMPEENGQIIELYDNVVITSDKKIKLDIVMIDGKGQWHMSGEYVMKARGIMAEDGVVALIFKVDTKTKELVWNIQIESRGFVYSWEVKSIHTQIVEFARAKYNGNQKKWMDIKDNLRQIKEELGEFVAKIIGRVPMLMPMFVYINKDPKGIAGDITQDEAILGMTLEEQGYND